MPDITPKQLVALKRLDMFTDYAPTAAEARVSSTTLMSLVMRGLVACRWLSWAGCNMYSITDAGREELASRPLGNKQHA